MKIKLVMILLLMTLMSLTACGESQKEEETFNELDYKPDRQLNQEDYDSIRNSMIFLYDGQELPTYEAGPDDTDYAKLKIQPKQTDNTKFYPILHYYNTKLKFGYSNYSEIVEELGEPNEEFTDGSTLHCLYDEYELLYYYFEKYPINSILIGITCSNPENINEFNKKTLEEIITGLDYNIENNNNVVINSTDYYANFVYEPHKDTQTKEDEIDYSISNAKLLNFTIMDKSYVREIIPNEGETVENGE